MKNKIFIIEDDANILYSLQAKFSVGGTEIETSNGNSEPQNVVKEIKKFKPDFIILDLILPKIDGFDMIKRIKGDAEILATPIFVFTNLSDKDSRDKAESLGGNYYFIKTDFNIDEFVKKVEKIIKNKKKNK